MSLDAEGIEVRISPLLAQVTGGVRTFAVRGATVDAALRDLGAREPALALHLFDDSGAVRRNIICLHRDTVVRPAQFTARTVSPGDEIVLTNALAAG